MSTDPPRRGTPRSGALGASGGGALDAVFDDAPIGFAVFDADLRYLQVNRALAEMNGLPVSAHLGRTLREVLPELADAGEQLLRRAMATGRPVGEVVLSGEVPGTPGVTRHWMESVCPVRGPDGTATGVVVMVWEITDRVRAERDLGLLLAAERGARAEATAARAMAEEAAARMRLLQSLAAALAPALDPRQVAGIVVSTAAGALGAQAATVSEYLPAGQAADGDVAVGRLRILAVTGVPEAVLTPGRVYPLEHWPLAEEVIRGRRPVVVTSFADRDRRYPAMAGAAVGQPAWVNLPLLVDAEPVGLMALGWNAPRDFTDDEIELLAAVAGQAAAALDRARLFEAERTARAGAELARRRLALLADASARLVAATTEAGLLGTLADLLVADLADWCAVLLPDDGHRLRRTVVRALDPGNAPLAEALTDAAVVPLAEDDPRHIAWRTGRPARLADWDDRPPAVAPGVPAGAAGGADLGEALRKVPVGGVLAVPLLARAQTLGVLAVFRTTGRPPFDDEEERLLADLGNRAGAALDNLRLLASRTRVAARLQEALLPERLPAIDGVELAAGYVAAEDAADVGGDLYDAFPLGDGSYGLVIGDVSGRGVDAAGLTGFARTTLRALGPELPPPAVLDRLNAQLIVRTGDERFLTVAYARLEPRVGAAALTVCTAGHPPPLLLRDDGTVTPLGVPGPLLGVLPEVDLVDQRYELAAGDLVLLYTDGVLEAHGRDGLFGEERLTELLGGLAGRPAAEVVARVEQAIVEYRVTGPDDLALLAVRLIPSAEPVERLLLDRRYPAEPAAVRIARRAARTAVAGMLSEDRTDDLLVGVSELVTNALRQLTVDPARSPRSDPIHLRIVHRGGLLRTEVTNPGPLFPLPDRPAEPTATSGRGLYLVRALTSDLGVTTSSGTTCVWFQIPCEAAG